MTLKQNFADGFDCFLDITPDLHDAQYDSSFTTCSGVSWLVFVYVASNLVILLCVDKVLQSSNRILGRLLAVSVFVAFLALGVYDTQVNFGFFGFFGSTISMFDIISIVILMIGMEIYGSDPEPDVEIITKYYSSIDTPTSA